MSDSIAAGEKSDTSGQLIVERLKKEGVSVVDYKIIRDDTEQIAATLRKYADEDKLDLVMTTGGTGLAKTATRPESVTRPTAP